MTTLVLHLGGLFRAIRLDLLLPAHLDWLAMATFSMLTDRNS